MKIAFAGTPDFAAVALEALQRAGHEIALVLTQPDRAAGRGLHPQPSAVKRIAVSRGLPVMQPASLKDRRLVADLECIAPEALVVAAYGLIVPREILAVPRRGGLNIHASLLPRWRGAAPIQRALLAGDAETGISIMQMDAGLDTGPVLLQEALPIAAADTAQTLHDRLAVLGARLIVRALEQEPRPKVQDEAGATYAAKIEKGEALIDWNEPAATLERKVRAFNPIPGASTSHRGTLLKIWRAEAIADTAPAPGIIYRANKDGITVGCGSQAALNVLELQRAGGRRLSAAAFLSGTALAEGDRLGDS